MSVSESPSRSLGLEVGDGGTLVAVGIGVLDGGGGVEAQLQAVSKGQLG